MYFNSSIDKKIYYEIHGEGNPVILLNGIMMSTASWKPFLPALSKTCKVILVDLLDMGLSDNMADREQYEQPLQADILSEFVDHLGLKKVSIMGISYGGEVAIEFACKYPDKLAKLMLFNTAGYTSDRLWASGEGWNAVGETLNGEAYYAITIPYFYSVKFFDENRAWMEGRKQILSELFSNKDFQDRMRRLVLSTEHYDYRDRLKEITAKTLILGCLADTIIPIKDQQYLHENIKGSSFVVIPDAGHCSMLEKPEIFVTLISGFVNLTEEIKI